MNTYSIPNKIKQPAQCCIHCGKSYIKRVNLDKHVVICEFLHKGKKKKIIIEEDDDSEKLPSQKQMFEILVELGQKYLNLEKKVDEITKLVVKKKKKINVLEWLNANVTPSNLFDNIIETIFINEQDIKLLFDNSFCDVLNEIFMRNMFNLNENETSIFAFVQKVNMFYIYDSSKIWVELSRETLIKFLNKIHVKVIKYFMDWKKEKIHGTQDDNYATKCNKIFVKLMGVEFNNNTTLLKIKSMMFSKMKTDMKAIVEYEFEF
jgi:hypothetical protein